MFPGRSARRRVRYGYHWVPYGMYTLTGSPSETRDDWRSRLIP